MITRTAEVVGTKLLDDEQGRGRHHGLRHLRRRGFG
jgi:hypothetical protein